jgi:hypothetical protein
MKKRIKPVQGYAVQHCDGWLYVYTVRHMKTNSIDAFMEDRANTSWRQLYRRGFRCIRVTITPAKKGKK